MPYDTSQFACFVCQVKGKIKLKTNADGKISAARCENCGTKFEHYVFDDIAKACAVMPLPVAAPLGGDFAQFMQEFKAKHPPSTVFPGNALLTTDPGWADPKSYLAPDEVLYQNVSWGALQAGAQSVEAGETIKCKAGSATHGALKAQGPNWFQQQFPPITIKIDHLAPECKYPVVAKPVPVIMPTKSSPQAQHTYLNVSPKKVYVGGLSIAPGDVFVTRLAHDQQEADKLVGQGLMTLADPDSAVQPQAALYQHFCANPLCQYHERLVPPRIAYAIKGKPNELGGLAFLTEAQFDNYHLQFGLDNTQVVPRVRHTVDLGGLTVEDSLCLPCSHALVEAAMPEHAIDADYQGHVPFCSNPPCALHDLKVPAADKQLSVKVPTKDEPPPTAPFGSHAALAHKTVHAHKLSVGGGEYLRFCDCCHRAITMFKAS